MRKYLILLLVCCGCVWSGERTTSVAYTSINGFCQGTTYSIVYSDTVDYQPAIEQLLCAFDASLSVYNTESTLSLLNGNLSNATDSLFRECFELSQTLHTMTEGLFDPTLGPLISAYGFGAHSNKNVVTGEMLVDLQKLTGMDKVLVVDGVFVKTDKGSRLDFNAIAQGMSADIVSDFLESMGVENFMVEIGGEIYCRGISPSGRLWRIGVDKPIQGNFVSGQELSAIVEISGKGLATSGNYRKFLEDDAGELLTHTIDPRTCRPATHNLLSATIVAPSAAIADAIATACMVGGLEWSKGFVSQHSDSVSCLLIYAGVDGGFEQYSTLHLAIIPAE